MRKIHAPSSPVPSQYLESLGHSADSSSESLAGGVDHHVASPMRVRMLSGPDVQAADIRQVLSKLLGWSGEVSLTPIGGGITNHVFKATCSEISPSILVRVFGENTDLAVDRVQDAKSSKLLSDFGFGPRLYGAFQNGRLEEFLEGAATLAPSDMAAIEPGCDLVGAIASELGRLHCLPVTGVRQPIMWNRLADFLRLARDPSFSSADGPASSPAAAKVASIDLNRAENDIKWVKNAIERASSAALAARGDLQDSHGSGKSNRNCATRAQARAWEIAGRIVFAHNDLLSGNILRLPELGDEASYPSPRVR